MDDFPLLFLITTLYHLFFLGNLGAEFCVRIAFFTLDLLRAKRDVRTSSKILAGILSIFSYHVGVMIASAFGYLFENIIGFHAFLVISIWISTTLVFASRHILGMEFCELRYIGAIVIPNVILYAFSGNNRVFSILASDHVDVQMR